MRADVPAEALWRISRTISAFQDLPGELNIEPFDLALLTQHTSNLTLVFDEVLQAAKTLNDDSIDRAIKQAQRRCMEFAGLIEQDARLGIPVGSDWENPEAAELSEDMDSDVDWFYEKAKQYAVFTNDEGHLIIRGMIEPDADTGHVFANSEIPASWVLVVRWMRKQYGIYNSDFAEYDLRHYLMPDHLMHVSAFKSCMSFLESLGVITPRKKGDFFIATGDASGIRWLRYDLREILPAILTHPELRIVPTTATQAPGPPIVPTVEPAVLTPVNPQPPKGITLMAAALLANEGDSEAAKITKKRWQNNRDPKLPKPIGKAAKQPQTGLYNPEELLKFIALVDPDSAHRVRNGCLSVPQTVADGCNPPSAK